jgi:hypothetical protein
MDGRRGDNAIKPVIKPPIVDVTDRVGSRRRGHIVVELAL